MEVRIHTTIWMNLENLMWSEKSQTLKAHMYYYIYTKGPEQANPET